MVLQFASEYPCTVSLSPKGAIMGVVVSTAEGPFTLQAPDKVSTEGQELTEMGRDSRELYRHRSEGIELSAGIAYTIK